MSIPPSALVNDMKRLMIREEMADVTFLVEGEEISANRAILAVRSEYFDVMLYGGMRESCRDKVGDAKPIELQDVSYAVFVKVIEYLYTDSVSELTWDLSVPLLIASEQFMLDRLKALCEDHIRKEITVDNVIGVLLASHQHNAVGLKDIALEFILRNLQHPKVDASLPVSGMLTVHFNRTNYSSPAKFTFHSARNLKWNLSFLRKLSDGVRIIRKHHQCCRRKNPLRVPSDHAQSGLVQGGSFARLNVGNSISV